MFERRECVAETPEIPEAKDPYERRVALTIAILAVVLSIIAITGERSKMEGLLSATEATDSWAHYQSQSIKEHGYTMQGELLEALNGQSSDELKRTELLKKYAAAVKKYAIDKEEIKQKAEALEKSVNAHVQINERCELAVLLLQIAIVFSSVAILVRWKALWLFSIGLGLVGALTALTIML
jgi:hypothetical protein